jgi:hypothetical protein
MTATTATSQGATPLVLFEEELAGFCKADKYREMAESFTTFVKSHPGVDYLAAEEVPAKLGDHLVKKYGSSSAFVTFTLRRPTWTTELRKALHDPSGFVSLVQSIETEVQDLTKQTKKLS